jgi:GH43 family beta-xylosidase
MSPIKKSIDFDVKCNNQIPLIWRCIVHLIIVDWYFYLVVTTVSDQKFGDFPYKVLLVGCL